MAKFELLTSKLQPCMYNIGMPVGKNSPNLPEDVALVTFLMRCSTGNQGLDPDVRIAFAGVSIGLADAALVAAINAWEKSRGLPPDGHVSVAHGANHPHGAFMIAMLNFMVKTDFRDIYPRIDKIAMPQCPALVVQLVQRSLVGG